jgi:hypothetical protein
VLLEGLAELKKSSDLIGNRTRDLPAFSIMPCFVFVLYVFASVESGHVIGNMTNKEMLKILKSKN